MAKDIKLSGPDFAQGVSLTEFAEGGMLQGHAQGEASLWFGAAMPTSQ
jgi:hypothetical protein